MLAGVSEEEREAMWTMAQQQAVSRPSCRTLGDEREGRKMM